MDLSVILPNYNHAHYLPHSLEAILTQSLPPKEVIIIDDASTDESVAYIRAMQKKYPQIKLLQNPINLGPVPTVNRGIEEAQSELLAFCSADDFVLPHFFQKAVTFLSEHPEVGLCTGNTCHFESETPHLLIPDRMPLGNKPQIFSKDILPKIFKKTTFFIHTNCAIYRRKHVVEFGGLNPKLLSISDWYLNCQIALHYGAGYIPTPVAAFRLSSQSYSSILKASPERDKIYHALMEEIHNGGEEWEALFRETGLLSHVGIRLVLFLAKHKEYQSFFPLAFLKKCHFHYNKLVKRGDPLKVEDLDSSSPNRGSEQHLQSEVL